MPADETIAERYQREIEEIAEVLLRRFYPPGTALDKVWSEALDIHRMQFIIDRLEPLPPKG